MVILIFPVLMCILAVPLILFGVAWALSLAISFIVGGAATWFIMRAYKKAKHKLDNQWRG